MLGTKHTIHHILRRFFFCSGLLDHTGFSIFGEYWNFTWRNPSSWVEHKLRSTEKEVDDCCKAPHYHDTTILSIHIYHPSNPSQGWCEKASDFPSPWAVSKVRGHGAGLGQNQQLQGGEETWRNWNFTGAKLKIVRIPWDFEWDLKSHAF